MNPQQKNQNPWTNRKTEENPYFFLKKATKLNYEIYYLHSSSLTVIPAIKTHCILEMVFANHSLGHTTPSPLS